VERNRDQAIRAREHAAHRVLISAASGRASSAALRTSTRAIARSAVVGPGGQRARTTGRLRRQRAHRAIGAETRHDASGSPQRSERSPASGGIDCQQASQTGPRVG
jgi:hypothetical protein